VTAIHQFVPTITPRDAIGHHVLELRDLLHGLGLQSEIYAAEVHGGLDDVVRPYEEYRAGAEPTALLYHAATTSVLAEYLVARPEPKIVDYHNVTPDRFFAGWDPGLAAALRSARREISAVVRVAALVVAHSHYSAREVAAWGHPDAVVAPVLGASFLDGGRESTDRGPWTAASGRAAELLFVGRLAPNKAQEQLIKALAIFRRTYEIDAVLHLVGSASPPAYGDALRRLATAAGVSDAVCFHENLSADALAARYASADVFVSASAHEGFCVPVVEAMRFGVPVVARASSAVPETAGGAAVLVPGPSASTLAVAVHRVLADPDLALRLRDAGRARAAALQHRERADYGAAIQGFVERMS
jgi:glycosyltransferase involved in cell wall biosynthesis